MLETLGYVVLLTVSVFLLVVVLSGLILILYATFEVISTEAGTRNPVKALLIKLLGKESNK